MPATEQTWRDQRLLHVIFAATAVLLLLATVLMFYTDHTREWKDTQRTYVDIDTRVASWRTQAQAAEVEERHETLMSRLMAVRSKPIDANLVAEFRRLAAADADRRETTDDLPALEELTAVSQKRAERAQAFRGLAEEINALAIEQRQLRQTQEAQAAAAGAETAAVSSVDQGQIFQRASQLAAQAKSLQEQAAAPESPFVEGDANTLQRIHAALTDAAQAAQKAANEATANVDAAVAARQQALEKLEDAFAFSDETALNAETAAAQTRSEAVEIMRGVITRARFREDRLLRDRKVKAAEYDEARATRDIYVRDNRTDAMPAIEQKIAAIKAELDQINIDYQAASEHRRDLQSVVDRLLAEESAVQKEIADNRADMERLQTAIAEQQSTFFVGAFPFLGKRWLELPILDAFNSPRKINNLWTEGLTMQYGSFSKVRRFDRCTTCHQAIDKTLPGSATEPAFVHGQELMLVLTTPTQEEQQALRDERDAQGNPLPFTTERVYGLTLADRGLVRRDEVAIAFVRNNSRAAQATLTSTLQSEPPAPAGDILERLLHTHGWNEAQPEAARQGLILGDVIIAINDTYVRDRAEAERLLLQRVDWGKPITLTIRRGLPHPFASHPRLDLFVGSLSPHPVTTFGCTVCHEGQGSATAFKWASHTPNDPHEAARWRRDHGWFANHHWIFPMYPERFAESTCLKCHHDVTELEPSSRFPEPPAPKVVKGHELVATYGCFGCHEINGYDGPNRRIGPDLRLEPNFYAAAQQLLAHIPEREELLNNRLTQARQQLEQATGEGGLLQGVDLTNIDQLEQTRQALQAELEAPTQSNSDSERLAQIRQTLPSLALVIEGNRRLQTLAEMSQLAAELVEQPEQTPVRRKLHRLIQEDIKLASGKGPQAGATNASARSEVVTALGPESHKLESVFKDVEVPGTLRKPGPALRYVASKNDEAFLLDWIRDPRHFRSNTRMPKFFELHNHLQASGHNGKHNESESNNRQNETEEATARNDRRSALEVAQDFEPIEVLGMTLYLLDRSQKFDYLEPPEGVVKSTPEEQIERGKIQFETRGCLACHTHDAFPKALEYRHEGDLVQGPDLSGIGSKFDPERNPDGARWLYSWIKDPVRYHPRTKMPNLFLEPYEDEAGNLIDPAADITAFLLSTKNDDWQPEFREGFALDAQGNLAPNSPAKNALRDLSLEYLSAAFYAKAAERYYEEGVPEEMRSELKGAEVELISNNLNDRQRLIYVGAKAISKYGCYGCHDIPGFEDAKPIGTGLADWGRKDTSRLAFEHITHYLHKGHSHAKPSGRVSGHASEDDAAAAHARSSAESDEPIPDFYQTAIEANQREGFIYQKLREPRSYDYEKVDSKQYNEWLRMPQFPFNNEEREQVITFVLGLVAEPPAPQFVYQPDERQKALNEGRRVLAKYNCGGCHTLEMEKLSLAFSPGDFRPQPPMETFPFVRPQFSPDELAASKQPDRRGKLHATISVQPFLDESGMPAAFDEYGDPVEPEEEYDPAKLEYLYHLFEPAVIDGEVHMVGPAPFNVKASQIEKRYPAHGGYLARYLVPRLLELERKTNPAAKANEAWGWGPPPLVGEGKKVQSDWLYNFLLNPYPIRPAAFLRMPKFNLSAAEAQALVDYFAARDNAAYPYEYQAQRQPGALAAKAAQYTAGDRLDDAMKIVTNNAGCVKCHLVSDFTPQGSPRAKAPNLADVYRRMRPEYLRPWIAKPDSILPYTGMPVNIHPETGFATQGLYHGAPDEQLDALVDLLMNYDVFAEQRLSISDLVQASNSEDAAPGAEESGAETSETTSASAEAETPATAETEEQAPAPPAVNESSPPADGEAPAKEPETAPAEPETNDQVEETDNTADAPESAEVSDDA